MANRGKGCLSCLRIGLLVSSILSLIIGDVIVGAGIYFSLFDSQQAIVELNQALPQEFMALRVTLIVTGTVIVLTSFCACVGVVLKSRCSLMLYSILTCFLVLSCSIAAVVMVTVTSLNLAFQTEMEIGLRRSYGNASLVTVAVDYAQRKLQCCGWNLQQQQQGGSNQAVCRWFNGTAWRASGAGRGSCPASCCPAKDVSEGSTRCSADDAFGLGCTPALQKYLVAFPLALVIAIIFLFIHMLCAMILVVKQKRTRRPAV